MALTPLSDLEVRSVSDSLPLHARKKDWEGEFEIFDVLGNHVATIHSPVSDDDARSMCITMMTLMNLAGPTNCSTCGAPATCFGSYEDELHPAYSCDACCGHGGEDGTCAPVVATMDVMPKEIPQ